MDPFSLASGIAGLVGVIATAVSTVYQYGSSVIGASKAQRDFLHELRALQIPLAKLEDIVSNADASSPNYPHISTELGSRNLVSLTFSEVTAIKSNQQAAQTDLKFQQVLEWLSEFAGDYRTKHNDVLLKRVSNTGKWLLDSPEFGEFTQGKDEFKSLWCYGLPGAGKTHLSCAVIDRISSKLDRVKGAVVYWYFDYLRASEHNPNLICASLLKQLVEGLTILPASIEELYDSNKGNKKGPDKAAFMRAIRSLLTDLEQSFVVVDALDECHDCFLKDHLAMVAELQEMGACVFITSRQPEIPDEKRSSEWTRVEIQAHENDLRCLVDHMLQNTCSNAVRRIMTDQLKEEIVTTIVSKTHGMFLWASLQLSEVLKGTTRSRIRVALASMPSSIHTFFDSTTSRIEHNDFAMRTLLWLAYAKEPLEFGALSHGLSIELEDGIPEDIDKDNIPCIESLVEACCGMVALDGKGNLRLAHSSIQEYLKGNSKKSESLNDLSRKFRQRIRDYPLLLYAAKRWRSHVSRDDESPEVKQSILRIYHHDGLYSSYSQAYTSFGFPHLNRFDTSTRYAFDPDYSPVHNAIELQLQTETIRQIFENMEVTISGANNWITPLIIAVKDNREDLVHMLLEAGADPSTTGRVPTTPEWGIFQNTTPRDMTASFKGTWYPSTLAFIMGHNAIFEALKPRVSFDVFGDIFTKAVSVPDGYEIVKDLLQNHATIPRHSTIAKALGGVVWASHSDPGKLLRLLLDAQPQLDDRDGILTDMLLPVIRYAPECVTLLLERGVKVKAGDEGPFPLWQAVSSGNREIALMLVDLGAEWQPGMLDVTIENEWHDLIKYMLDSGYDVNASSVMGTPITSAIVKNDMETLCLVLSRGANLQEGCNGLKTGKKEQRSALEFAAEFGRVDMAKILLEKGANPNYRSMEGTPLIYAACSGKEDIIALLINHGADVNLVADTTNSLRDTALCGAASSGSLAACQLLLANGADPKYGKNMSPLLAAVASSDNYPQKMQIIELLLENGDDPMAQGYRHQYPLECAVLMGNEDIVRLFLKNGASLDACGKRGGILHAAAQSRNKDMVQIMIGLGAKVVEESKKHEGVLHWARRKDYQLLIDHGADVNAGGGLDGPVSVIQSAIERHEGAAEDGICEAIDFLVEAGADVNASCRVQGSALQAASHLGMESTVELLLGHGASPNVESDCYGTALQAAAFIGNELIVEMLISSGADVNQKAGQYATALQAASFQGHEAVVRLLLDHGADVAAKGGKFRNALRAARQMMGGGHKVVQKILLSHGAVDDGD
ncbi:multiple ankyrin repeats single kh domain [Trichoderma arundinaceum]|uniref:Multiple ankyrin repeats single kh domain n=1 Tax=Trichoderma arundinaceum TaxID=490622 RepID=A0A395NXK5_TRIAR|nr:multiple ankyrin repeats single kh domain [Trichoderma arundinaceum]